MTYDQNDPLRKTIETALSDSPGLIDFALAVVRHLSGPSIGMPAERAIADVLAALDASDRDSHGPEVHPLSENPELLASFFQNADMLDPKDPSSASIANAVLEAIERAGGMT